MAEQLNKNNYLTHPDKIGSFNYYSLGETTIKQLQNHKLISSKTKKYQAKKPDALITDDRNNVLVFIENKDIGKIDSIKNINSAIEQEIDVAKTIGSKIFIVTDTVKSYWINPLTSERILDEDGNELNETFKPHENKKNLEKLIRRITSSISKDINQIKKINYLDPSDLARSVHQHIWIAKNSSPETCLYTFVELFIFKYLSDLNTLTGPYSFNFLNEMYENTSISDEEVLAYYLGDNGPREKIKDLFPSGDDGTTVVNGDIFHAVKDQNGEYIVNGDGSTFRSIIEEFVKYEKNNGKFININKEFKSKLFESFLKNEKDKKKMGQFFTPLKVIEQINRMFELKENMSICDPACGVGKFLLETISLDVDSLFQFSNGDLIKKIDLVGFDKYSEDNSDRTIILAKANMLIYLSKLISENPNSKHTKQVAKLFNDSFKLKKSNLGTLENLEEEKYDVILTNPPYVVNGSSSIKQIANATGNYTWNGLGLEALFMEWIVKSLKEKGLGFIVIPDGILSNVANSKLRESILELCYIEGIISLPINTFFGTPKKTFILALKKKTKLELTNRKIQKHPVFTYICNSIGESLDVYRFEEENNDLEQAVNHYRLYQASPDKKNYKAINYNSEEQLYIDNKCKLIPIKSLYETFETDWNIDNYWSDEEKIKLGLKKETNIMTVEELQLFINGLTEDIAEYNEDLLCLM